MSILRLSAYALAAALTCAAPASGAAQSPKGQRLNLLCIDNHQGSGEKRCRMTTLADKNEFDIDAGLQYLCSDNGTEVVRLWMRAAADTLRTEDSIKVELWWNQENVRKFDLEKIRTQDDERNEGKMNYWFTFKDSAKDKFIQQVADQEAAWLRAPLTGEERKRIGETAWVGFILDYTVTDDYKERGLRYEHDSTGDAIEATRRECGIETPAPEEPASKTGRRD